MTTTRKLCLKCEQLKPLDAFTPRKDGVMGCYSYCKQCRNTGSKTPAFRRKRRQYYADNKAVFQRSRHKRRKQERTYDRQRRQKRREAIIKRYGGRCACCGESRIEFLGIDHVNGGGSRERQQRGYYPMMTRLLRSKEPLVGYRVLCHNCNQALGAYGYCPHGGLAEC